MTRFLTYLIALAATVTLAAGCSTAGTAPETSTADTDEYVVFDEPEAPDCDAEDRRRNEVPDCGYLKAGRFVPWSWVRAGATKPPKGWSSVTEMPKATSVPKPVKPPTKPTRTVTKPKSGRR